MFQREMRYIFMSEDERERIEGVEGWREGGRWKKKHFLPSLPPSSLPSSLPLSSLPPSLPPSQPSSRHLSLEVGEDRVVLKTRPEKFFLDVDLPFLVDSDESGAQFNQQTRVLTATLPVTGPAPLL